MNADMAAGRFDNEIKKMTELQSFLGSTGSDLQIRRNTSVKGASVAGLLLHIRKKEWNNTVNLASEAGLAKVKTIVLS